MGNPLCHFEFLVSDVEAAQAFYGKAFGWTLAEGPGGYTFIRTGAYPDGGIMRKPDGSPFCTLQAFFLVDDIEATLARVREAKGLVIVLKTEVPGLGWYAVFFDPDQIPVAIWQNPAGGPAPGPDERREGVGNPLCHWEFMVTDVARTKAFYGKVFDWELDDSSMPGYTLVKTGRDPGGGIMAKPAEAPMPGLHQYFLVDEIEDTLKKVTEAGGAVVVPKTEIPNVGHFAMFLDPDKIPVGIFQAPA